MKRVLQNVVYVYLFTLRQLLADDMQAMQGVPEKMGYPYFYSILQKRSSATMVEEMTKNISISIKDTLYANREKIFQLHYPKPINHLKYLRIQILRSLRTLLEFVSFVQLQQALAQIHTEKFGTKEKYGLFIFQTSILNKNYTVLLKGRLNFEKFSRV